MNYKEWEEWGRDPDSESRCNIQRVRGYLSHMESAKQLVKLIANVYEPEMKILDVGCNVGHYLSALRTKFPDLEYTGVDAYENYINIAKEEFSKDSHAHFEVKDIFEPIFSDSPFDIVFCCNVLLHLPDFRLPVKNLLASTKKICLIRTLLDDYTNLVKSPTDNLYNDEGNPKHFWYFNTWEKSYFIDFINKIGWNVELIEDEFKPENIQQEFDKIKAHPADKATRILNGKQIVENIIFNWVWIKITRK